MITAKESVKIALSYVKEFFPEEKEITLEEIEFNDNKKDWAITVSFLDKNIVGGGIAALTQQIANAPRKYKSIFVNAETGNVDAMKIRTLA